MIPVLQTNMADALLLTCSHTSEQNIRFTFYKESHGTWYIDLPDYPGPKANLAMVAGADTMLDYLAKGKKCVKVDMSEKPFKGALALELVKLGEAGPTTTCQSRYPICLALRCDTVCLRQVSGEDLLPRCRLAAL